MEDEAVLTSSSLLPGTYTCTASNTLEKKSKEFIVKAKNKGRGELWSACPQVAVSIRDILIRLLFCQVFKAVDLEMGSGDNIGQTEDSTKRISLLQFWRQKWQCIYDSTYIYEDHAIRVI